MTSAVMFFYLQKTPLIFKLISSLSVVKIQKNLKFNPINKKMSDQKFPGQFPNEIITEILTRLPAKSVCRFKCVSKTWNSLICNPHFVTSYIAHNSSSSSSSSSSSWIIVDRFVTESNEKVTQFNPAQNPNISSLSANHHRLIYEPVTREWKPIKNPPVILACNNGLLLFSFDVERDPFKEHAKNPNQFSHRKSDDVLVVINPVTNEWVPLPKPKNSINKLNSVGFMSRLDCSCNGVVEKFIVVEYQPIIGSDSGSLLCFSSDTGKWVDKPASYMLGMHFWRAEGVFVFAGRFFWVDLSCGVIAWDDDDPFRGVEEEKEMARCRFILLPKGCRKPFNTLKLEDERDIFGAGGYIHYMEMFRKGDYVLKLWRLKDFESGVNEWNLVYNLSRVDVESVLCCGVEKSLPRPCFAHPFDVDIVFFSTKDRIFSFNLRTQKVEANASFTGHKYVIPFVLPCWPASLPPRLYATYAKEEGNELFMNKKFDDAINCYSKSIALSPTAFAYANRALVYLKVCRFQEAEDDCTESLKLHTEYFKVYARRAIARKELGNLEGSMEDINYALKLEPHNKAMKEQLAEIKILLEKASYMGSAGHLED